tara:strand:+ start:8052 stop:9830 length:1779 start_codon:yes stop_codon:yes gene_type:complete
MISIVYCTREHNQEHIDHLKKMAGHPKVEVIEYLNDGISLTKAYNELLEKTTHDIVVFCHDDIQVETKQFANKLKKHYDNNDHAILGVAGTKQLPKSGRWWDNRKAMYGRVWHTHEGKKALSKYSDDQGTRIEDTVIVDGVFFSVMKSRLKETFDESVEGFHFYDVDLCFRNYLKGVKVGVHTNIVINHMSIGQTNKAWEDNRIKFASKYSGNLPEYIYESFDNRKLKVLLTWTTEDNDLIESLDLAKELIANNCTVSLIGTWDYETSRKLVKTKIAGFNINEPPGFKLGDGKFSFMSEKGPVVSEEGKMYKLAQADFDIIYSTNENMIKAYKMMYPECMVININTDTYIEVDKTAIGLKGYFTDLINAKPIDRAENKDLEYKPLINILTRTSGRPNGFKINRDSVTNQTYKNIRHLVCIDDDKSEEYVKDSGVDYIKIDREKIIEEDKIADFKTGPYSPHNLYFNKLLGEVKDGWVLILDDDDKLTNDHAIETMVKHVKDEDTMVIHQMMFVGNRALPPTNVINDPPKLGQIGSPCILYHSKYSEDEVWDGWKCGDFRFIEKIYNKIPNKVTIPETLVTVGQIGHGNKQDL